MNLYLAVLKAFLSTSTWRKYGTYVDGTFLKENMPELHRLYLALPFLHKERDESFVACLADLEIAYASCYPATNLEDIRPIFDQLQETQVDLGSVVNYLDIIRKREAASRLATRALAVAEGNASDETLSAEITAFQEAGVVEDIVSPFVEYTLDQLETMTYAESGLRWRLGTLNRYLGSLRKGDFGFVFARPETGKTTFLASEVTAMADQADGPILWINNEEQGYKVLLRCIQATTGCTLAELYADKPRYQRAFDEGAGRNLKIIDEVGISKKRITELCEAYQPKLIIIDQIDKITGFSDDRLDIELKNIYIWARELAKTYGPVIGICQAGQTGDGKRWLTMNDVDNSKTGKQGEADWILGIGAVYDDGLEYVRYLCLSKNKLLGDADSDPSMRHGKWECRIRPEIARYEDF